MDIQQNIIDWLFKLKGWQTELAYKILTKTIDKDDINEIIALLKTDSIFTQKDFPQISNFEITNQIKLLSIDSIQNIENLAPRNSLKFEKDKNMLVIYGANGSGKSSYTKIIKKISGKPKALNLKPNVFNPSPDGKCKITYLIDNVEHQVDWEINTEPIEDLKSIDVFDTSTGNI